MFLSDLILLIQTCQIKQIRFIGFPTENQGFNYEVHADIDSKAVSPILITERNETYKTYTSLDRALSAMRKLGYMGKYTIEINDN